MKSENPPFLKLFGNETPPDNFINALQLFLESSDEKIKIILDNIKLDINITPKDDITELAEKFSLDKDLVKKIINVSSFVFCELEENKLSLDDLHNDFLALKLTKEDYEKIKNIYDNVGKSFVNRYLIYRNTKKNLNSILPKYLQIKRNINLRIIIDDNQKKNLNFIPIAQIEMEFGEIGDYDLRNQKIKFQATLNEINKIIEELNKIKLEIVSISEYSLS